LPMSRLRSVNYGGHKVDTTADALDSLDSEFEELFCPDRNLKLPLLPRLLHLSFNCCKACGNIFPKKTGIRRDVQVPPGPDFWQVGHKKIAGIYILDNDADPEVNQRRHKEFLQPVITLTRLLPCQRLHQCTLSVLSLR